MIMKSQIVLFTFYSRHQYRLFNSDGETQNGLSRIFCTVYHPKSEVQGEEDQRVVSSFTSQEVSLTITMRQTSGERGQPREAHLQSIARPQHPLKQLSSGLKEHQVSQRGKEVVAGPPKNCVCEKKLSLGKRAFI